MNDFCKVTALVFQERDVSTSRSWATGSALYPFESTVVFVEVVNPAWRSRAIARRGFATLFHDNRVLYFSSEPKRACSTQRTYPLTRAPGLLYEILAETRNWHHVTRHCNADRAPASSCFIRLAASVHVDVAAAPLLASNIHNTRSEL